MDYFFGFIFKQNYEDLLLKDNQKSEKEARHYKLENKSKTKSNI